MDFYPDNTNNIDLREEMHAVLYGRADLVAQGRQIILRRVKDDKCICWDKVAGGSSRPNCKYCQGEGRLFRETLETMAFFRGVAPVYKPGILASGQYPQSDYGYTDPNRATAYCEYTTFPDYERYTRQDHESYDRLYELKVDDEGNTVQPMVRVAKWKVLSVIPIQGDNGRIEFFELGLEKMA